MIVPGGGISLDGQRWVSCQPLLPALRGKAKLALAQANLSPWRRRGTAPVQ
jgi:hypothetical protein